MRILITGGCGFIGTHLALDLSREHEVVVLDLNKPRPEIENKVTFIPHDVCEPFDHACDQIFHLACPASPIHYQKNPLKTLETAFLGTRNALELAHKKGIPILIASTSEVYGDPLIHPQGESYFGNVNTFGPRSCYDEGKRASESLAYAYHEMWGTQIKVIRIFNTYGPYMAERDGRVIPQFIQQALNNHPLTLFGGGTQTRSFQYVDDLVRGMKAMIESKITGPINLGNPHEITLLQLAQEIIDLTGSKSSLEFHPLPKDDPLRRKPDISYANQALLWKPTVALKEGLKQTIDYFAKKECYA